MATYSGGDGCGDSEGGLMVLKVVGNQAMVVSLKARYVSLGVAMHSKIASGDCLTTTKCHKMLLQGGGKDSS